MNRRQKMLVGTTGLLFVIGAVCILLVAYFLIQSVREHFYQRAFDQQYELQQVEEAEEVFHGVKIQTYHTNEGPDGNKADVIVEMNDEVVEELKGRAINPASEEMKVYSHVVRYSLFTDKKRGKEELIVILNSDRDTPVYRTYRINENGVVSQNDFTTDSKSKQETQFLNGISEEQYGYYTNLPYQDGSWASLIFLGLMGIGCLISAAWIRRTILEKREEPAA
ncbi:hypothetical protein ACRTEV_13100 [Rossellomorea arthrocnemi]